MAANDREVALLDKLAADAELAGDSYTSSVLEYAVDCANFVSALWEAMGEDPEELPDLSRMENLYDAYQGELSAAALFLSDHHFSRLPEVLRESSKALEENNDGSVPTVVVKGYARFAKRIEHVRSLQQQSLHLMSNNPNEGT